MFKHNKCVNYNKLVSAESQKKKEVNDKSDVLMNVWIVSDVTEII